MLKKTIIYLTIIFVFFLGVAVLADMVILPNIVDAEEYVIPNFEGQHKDEAIKTLQDMKLNPIVKGPRYNEKVPKDHIIYQKPRPGTHVKENRRVYIFISGGEPLIAVPELEGKTIRDSKINLERLGLVLGEIEEVVSEYPAGLVINQDIEQGEKLAMGDTVRLQVSLGPQVGKSKVPNLVGESLQSSKKKLRQFSLRLGKVTYVKHPTLLPNTIISQYPRQDELVQYGDSVDVYVSRNSDDEPSGDK